MNEPGTTDAHDGTAHTYAMQCTFETMRKKNKLVIRGDWLNSGISQAGDDIERIISLSQYVCCEMF